MQRSREDTEFLERARKQCRLSEAGRGKLLEQDRYVQLSDPSGRSYGNIVVDRNAAAVVGDVYGNMVINHIPVEKEGPRVSTLDLLLESLPFERMDARLRNVGRALPNTCQWLLYHEKYRAWVDPLRIQEHHGFLWIKGKPGCGKSTMMKIALDQAKEDGPAQTILSYFFNARAPGTLEKSSIGLYRSLVHQALTKVPVFRRVFEDAFAYKVRNGIIDEWTAEELRDFLIEVMKSPQVPETTIFVDALDEGDKDDVRTMIAFLEDLGGHAISADNRLRICLSSRHFPHISIRKGLILVMENQDEHSQDIKVYVQTKLHGDHGLESCHLRQEVCDKAAGIFLWVVLVVAMLNKTYDDGGSIEAIRRHLKRIPPELDDLFVDIITKTRDDLEECVTLLQLVLFSNSGLSARDLYVAIHHSCHRSQPMETTSVHDAERLARRLLHFSRGLVEATKSEQPIMQFIHESVRDFLVTPRGLARVLATKPEQVSGLSHEKLKLACLRSIACCRMPSRGDTAATSVPDWLSFRPFLQYATNEIFRHANSAHQAGICQAKFLTSFDAILPKWIRLHNSYFPTPYHAKTSLLYITSQQGLVHLVGCLLDGGVDVNTLGGRHGTALQVACVKQSTGLVQLLLDRGADPNIISGEFGHVLAAAVHLQNRGIIEILQKHTLDVPHETLTKMFQESVMRGYGLGVQVSLDQGIDVNEPLIDLIGREESFDEPPLYTASARGFENTVQLLINAGADTDALGGYYGSALQVASRRGYEKVVQVLVNSGVDINAQGKDFGTALHVAAEQGFVKVAQILVDAGADVNAKGGYFGSAIQAASRNGHKKTVQFLLDSGASINAQGGYYGGALQAASTWGHRDIVRLLLDHGAVRS